MNKKQTMIASIAAVTAIGAALLIAGFLNAAESATTSRYSADPLAPGSGVIGTVQKLIVEIDSPFGFEKITSFKLFQTDNMMKESSYYTLRLFGPIANDKRTLLTWIANDMGELPNGLTTELPITTGGGKPAKMTTPKEGQMIDKIPLTGKVTLKLLEGYQDAYATSYVRQIEYSGCHVAGYHMGTNYDDEKAFFKDGIEHVEEVVFACKSVRSLTSASTDNRGIIVERAYDDSDRQITNEKGELITSSREYRQPIVIDNSDNVKVSSAKQEIVTRIELDKTSYNTNDKATFTVTFTDIDGNNINPDKVRAIYDSKMVQLDRQDVGVYTFVTPELAKASHQLIVIADKDGFPTDTTYLSIPISRIS